MSPEELRKIQLWSIEANKKEAAPIINRDGKLINS
jgi:hypothetical protein